MTELHNFTPKHCKTKNIFNKNDFFIRGGKHILNEPLLDRTPEEPLVQKQKFEDWLMKKLNPIKRYFNGVYDMLTMKDKLKEYESIVYIPLTS
jgi:hypothetical protein